MIAWLGASRLSRDRQANAPRQCNLDAGAGRLCNGPFQKIHRRRSDEACDEAIARGMIEIERASDLLDAALVQHHDAIGHGHGLNLIMGHIDHGCAQLPAQPGQFQAHLHAQLGIQI